MNVQQVNQQRQSSFPNLQMPTVPNYIQTAGEESKDPTLESKVDDEIMWQDKTKDLRPSKRRNKTPVTQDKF